MLDGTLPPPMLGGQNSPDDPMGYKRQMLAKVLLQPVQGQTGGALGGLAQGANTVAQALLAKKLGNVFKTAAPNMPQAPVPQAGTELSEVQP